MQNEEQQTDKAMSIPKQVTVRKIENGYIVEYHTAQGFGRIEFSADTLENVLSIMRNYLE
jgi:hypothetical protein